MTRTARHKDRRRHKDRKRSRARRRDRDGASATSQRKHKRTKHDRRSKRRRPRSAKPRPAAAAAACYDSKSEFEAKLRKLYPHLKVYPVDPAAAKALRKRFRDQKIPYSRRLIGKPGLDPEDANWVSYKELFDMLSGRDHKSKTFYSTCIKGGFVRDLVCGVPADEIHDLDMTFDKPLNRIQYGVPYGLIHRNVQFSTVKAKADDFFFLRVGEDHKRPVPMANGTLPTIHQAVEGTYNPFPWPAEKLDAPMNSLLLHVGRDLKELDRVYDITGHGYTQAKQRVWTWPDPTMATNAYWMEHKKLWRMLKFAKRGYKVPAPVRKAIYAHWLARGAAEDFHYTNWKSPWRDIATVPAREVGDLCRWLLTHLGEDFAALELPATDAVRLVKLMVEKSMLTVPSQFAYLVEYKQLAKTNKRISERLRTKVQASNNPDIQQLYARLDALAGRRSAGPVDVFQYVHKMIDVGLVTTHPIRSDFSEYRVHKGLKQHPLVGFPEALTATDPAWRYPLSETTAAEMRDAFDAHTVPTSLKTKTPTLAHVLAALTAHADVDAVHLAGPFVESLWTKRLVNPACDVEVRVVPRTKAGGAAVEVDVVAILRKVVGAGGAGEALGPDAAVALGEHATVRVGRGEGVVVDVGGACVVG